MADEKKKVAPGFKRVTITNTDPGARGIHAREGHVILAPGESQELDLSDAEYEDLPEHFAEKGKERPVDTRTPSERRQERREEIEAARLESDRKLKKDEVVEPVELTEAEKKKVLADGEKALGHPPTQEETDKILADALAAKTPKT